MSDIAEVGFVFSVRRRALQPRGAGASNLAADANQRASQGRAVRLFGGVTLAPGWHALHLYDDAWGGCACNTGGCSVSVRVFADAVWVRYAGGQ